MNPLALQRVTFTGADDTTDPAALAVLARRHPWIEFAVLISPSQQGSGRYPSRSWRDGFYRSGVPYLQRALHLCGRALDLFLAGDDSLCREIDQVHRVQLNFVAERLPPAALRALPGVLQEWRVFAPDVEFVLQLNQANRVLPSLFPDPAAQNLSFLVDASGGRGIAPALWPEPLPNYPTAYAGGIGHGGLDETLDALARVNAYTSIDMESSLRTGDRFDLDKVSAVLDQLHACCVEIRTSDGAVELHLRLHSEPGHRSVGGQG